MIETKNALITSTMLGIEDHGIMSFFLYLDYGDSGHQGAGGYCLDEPLKDRNGRFIRRVGSANGMDLIMKILEVVDVEKWEDLPSKHIRVKAEYTKVHAIGHITKDKWLDFDEFWSEMKELAKEK